MSRSQPTTDDRVGRLQLENEALEARVALLLVRVQEAEAERDEARSFVRGELESARLAFEGRALTAELGVQEAERALREITDHNVVWLEGLAPDLYDSIVAARAVLGGGTQQQGHTTDFGDDRSGRRSGGDV